MIARYGIAAGAILGFLGVAIGAFGAHALKGRLSPEAESWLHLAVSYQFRHALALLAVGVWWHLGTAAPVAKWLNVAAGGFLLGTLIFCGSLYALAATDVRAWGAVTPLGGVALLVGWAALGWAGLLAGRGSR